MVSFCSPPIRTKKEATMIAVVIVLGLLAILVATDGENQEIE